MLTFLCRIIHIFILGFTFLRVGTMTEGLQSQNRDSWRIYLYVLILGNYSWVFSFLSFTKLFWRLVILRMNCGRNRVWRWENMWSFWYGIGHKLILDRDRIDSIWPLWSSCTGWGRRLGVGFSITLIIWNRWVYYWRNSSLTLVDSH